MKIRDFLKFLIGGTVDFLGAVVAYIFFKINNLVIGGCLAYLLNFIKLKIGNFFSICEFSHGCFY